MLIKSLYNDLPDDKIRPETNKVLGNHDGTENESA